MAAVSVVHLPDPLTELQSVWHCGAEENDTDVIGKHNQNLLPHNPSLRKANTRGKSINLENQLEKNESVGALPDLSVVDVVNLIEDHPLQVPDDLWTVVKHRPERGEDGAI